MSSSQRQAGKVKIGMRSLSRVVVLLAALSLGGRPCGAQIADGDEQFQVIHQDIGRISGGASVAPQTTLVRQPAEAPEPLAAPAAPRQRQAQLPARRQAAQAPQQATRKPSRITLAVRTAAPVQVSLAGFERSAAAALFASQPRAEASFRAGEQHTLVASVQPGGLRSSESSRHSALIAQVAAERAAAAAAEQAAPTEFPSGLQASLGSPMEALSAPSVAQVQPPPLLQVPQASAPEPLAFANQPEEPLAAPSFEQVLGQGCPKRGVFSYENKDHCDRYYMCTNGTFTEEACPNGLAYSQMGAVYQHCAYNWNVDCGRKKAPGPLASPGCPWQFGIFPIGPNGQCSVDYYVCEWGVPETRRCSPEGLFYDDRIKGCQWADQLGCKSEALLNFKCPPEDEDNPYWPYPRYYHNKQDIIVCVNEQPRLVHCADDQAVDPSSLACLDLNKKKKPRRP